MESTIISQLATSSAKGNTIEHLTKLDYWVGTPLQASLNHWPVLIPAILSTLILIFVLTVVAVKLLKKGLTPPQQKYLSKLALAVAWFGPLGWVLVLARIFAVVFFSARFWWVIWFVALSAIAVWLVRDYKKLPAKQIQYQTDQLKKRYFPKKRKR